VLELVREPRARRSPRHRFHSNAAAAATHPAQVAAQVEHHAAQVQMAPSPAAVAVVRRTHPSDTSGAASDTPARLDVEHEPLGVEADAGNDGVLQLHQVSEYTGDAHGTSDVAVGLGTSEATVCSVRIFLRSQ